MNKQAPKKIVELFWGLALLYTGRLVAQAQVEFPESHFLRNLAAFLAVLFFVGGALYFSDLMTKSHE